LIKEAKNTSFQIIPIFKCYRDTKFK